MANPILRITDSATFVDLLSPRDGYHLLDWTPALPEPKGGGTFVSSPLSDGRRMVMRHDENAIETFELKLNATNQDSAIAYSRNLRELLTKAHNYWTTTWQNDPVYLEVRGSDETNIRYAIIKDWRYQADDNPFAQPFFSRRPVMDDLTVVIERGVWLSEPPGLSSCVPISSQKGYYFGALTTSSFVPTATLDDVYAERINQVIVTGLDLKMGVDWQSSGTEPPVPVAFYRTGVRFRSVTVPAGATIVNAYIRFDANQNGEGTFPIELSITGESNVSPSAFSTYSNFMERVKTAASEDWTTDRWVQGNYYYTAEIRDIVQEIIDLPGWASGNNMVIFVLEKYDLDRGYNSAASYDSIVEDEPRLYITYSTDTLAFGQEATCDNGVYIANKENQAQISHIYRWQDKGAGGAWSADNFADDTAFEFLETGCIAGSYIVFGCQSSSPVSGPLCSLVFDVGVAMAGITTGVWERYTGSWTTFVPRDNTNGFTTLGVNSVSWEQSVSETPVIQNGVTSFWYRYRITVGTVTTPGTQQNRLVYTQLRPSLDVAADQVSGDLPALLRLRLINQSIDPEKAEADALHCSRVHIGLRSRSRGEDFSPYFNASDEQHQSGVSCAAGTTSTFDDDTYSSSNFAPAPTKRILRFNPAGTEDYIARATWTIAAPYSDQYRGTYQAFLRCAQSTATDGIFLFKLACSATAQTEITPPVVFNPAAAYLKHSVALGYINIVPSLGDNDSIGAINLALQVKATAAGALVVYDLILLPIDEWAGIYTSQNYSDDGILKSHMLDIDPITHPKGGTRALLRDLTASEQVKSIWARTENGIPFLQADADQSLYFYIDQLTSTNPHAYSRHEILLSANLMSADRYWSMRGKG